MRRFILNRILLSILTLVILSILIFLTAQVLPGNVGRAILGPLAHRLLEAERTGDHGTMWDLAEDSFKASIERDRFVARLDACPRRRPSRQVIDMQATSRGVWEVQWVNPSGAPGLAYFRQEEPYRFGAILDDGDLVALLAAPLEQAPTTGWCQRR